MQSGAGNAKHVQISFKKHKWKDISTCLAFRVESVLVNKSSPNEFIKQIQNILLFVCLHRNEIQLNGTMGQCAKKKIFPVFVIIHIIKNSEFVVVLRWFQILLLVLLQNAARTASKWTNNEKWLGMWANS